MKNKTGLLLLILLILANHSFAQRSSKYTKDFRAPEATTAEAKLKFRDIPKLKKAFINTSPADRKDGILVGELALNSDNKAMILKLAKGIFDGKHGNSDALLISHKNKLVLESYYRKGRINLPHPQASATKGYTTLALGRAIQLGYLSMADLHKPLISFLKDLDRTKLVQGAEKITLHKALTMRSGIRISAEKRRAMEKNPNQLKGQGQMQAYLENSAPITAASQVFKYGDGPVLVMQVIEAVVPGSAKDFIKKELLDKMGITNYRWKTSVSGLPESGWRVSMTSRDMIKWGTLVLNKGKWNGEQLIPEAFIAKATSRITQPTETWQPKTYRYGYFWYQTNIMFGGKSYSANMAWGGGGQHIVVIKALDLVIAINGYDRDDKIMTQVSNIIVPAFAGNEFPPLKDRYLGQKPPGLTPELFAPGLVSTEKYVESLYAFAPDMKEFYFNRIGGKYKKTTFFVMQYKNHQWSKAANLSTDINKFIERFAPGLSEIKNLEPFKKIPIVGSAVSAKGTYYFYILDFKDGSGHLSYSRLVNGQYEKPKKMNESINSGKWIAHPFVAPDESYIMWDAEKNGSSTPDIYISFRQKDGSWGPAISLGVQINTPAYEQRPRVTPDGKYLFFWRGDKKTRQDGSKYWVGNPHWVDARIIETLRPKK